MKAIRLTNPGKFEICEIEETAPSASHEALVSIESVGLCGTDIHAYLGNQPFFEYPRILGHELGVRIEELGDSSSGLSVGQTCSVEPYLSRPGDVAYRRGKTNCCSSTQCLGVHIDGGMRERFVLPIEKLHPSTLSAERLALVETLCIGHHAVERARMHGDESVGVIGTGPIGLGASLFATQSGASVTCIDISDSRLARAQELISGATTLRIESGGSLCETWDRHYDERPEIVIDCTGSRASMEAAFELPGHGGTFVLVGIYNGNLTFSDPSMHKRELSVLCSRNATAGNFRSVIELLESGTIDVDPWITHRCSADDFPAAIEEWLRPGSNLLKGVISF